MAFRGLMCLDSGEDTHRLGEVWLLSAIKESQLQYSQIIGHWIEPEDSSGSH